MKAQPAEDHGKPTDYLANERTFLAWVRTGVTIIALGFVVVKFGLWAREIDSHAQTSNRLSAPIGVALVLLGGVLVLAALARFRAADRAIAAGSYHTETLLPNLLALGVALVAVLLAVYLAVSS